MSPQVIRIGCNITDIVWRVDGLQARLATMLSLNVASSWCMSAAGPRNHFSDLAASCSRPASTK